MAIRPQPRDLLKNLQKPYMILGRIHSADMNAERAGRGDTELPPHSGGVRGHGELASVYAVINHSAPRVLPPLISPGVLQTGSTHAKNSSGRAIEPAPHERSLQQTP